MEIRWRNWHGFVVSENLDIPGGGALQAEYRDEASGRFYSCCMMPDLTGEELRIFFASYRKKQDTSERFYCFLNYFALFHRCIS